MMTLLMEREADEMTENIPLGKKNIVKSRKHCTSIPQEKKVKKTKNKRNKV